MPFPRLRSAAGGRSDMIVLLPIMIAELAAFLTIGLALPVLPLYVHRDLGFGSFAVGLVTGCQFGAAVFSRVWAGHFADTRGPKRAVVTGLLGAAASGLLYFLSLRLAGQPAASLAVLLAGRALLGVAESFIITGGVSWGLALVGAEGAGKVIAWVGTAMFAALAVGAPIGTTLYLAEGFAAIAAATVALPLATWLAIARTPAVAPSPGKVRPPLRSVAAAVWLPGAGAACSSIGYGAILAFSPLLFSERGWHPVWIAFTAFAGALIVARLALGHLPDRLGGARVARIFVVVEAAGLGLMWWAAGPWTASAGAAITGFGYSLVYPGLGMEAVRDMPADRRGVATGMYTMFLDVALGLGSPGLGLVAGWTDIGGVFAASALVALCTLVAVLRILKGRGAGRNGTVSPAAR